MATLDDVVAAIEELAEKTEIQPTNFDQQTPVNIGTTATQILPVNTNRKGFYICNNGDETIFLGNSSVTTATGLPFYPGDVLSEEDLPVTAAIYGRVEADTEQVRILEET